MRGAGTPARRRNVPATEGRKQMTRDEIRRLTAMASCAG